MKKIYKCVGAGSAKKVKICGGGVAPPKNMQGVPGKKISTGIGGKNEICGGGMG